MIAFFYGTSFVSPSTSANNFLPFELASGTWTATEANVYQPIPHALTLDQLKISITTAPGTGKSYTYAVMQNGSPTTLAVTISDSNTSGSDLSHSVNFSAGDTISLRAAPSGTPTAPTRVSWSARQSASGQFAVLTGSDGTSLSTASGTLYLAPHGNVGSSTIEATASTPAPMGGTLKNLYVVTDVSTTWTINLRKGGATGPTVALSSTSSGHDTSTTTAFVTGDLINMQLVPTLTTTRFGIGYTVAPTTDGDSWLMHADVGNAPSTSATNYNMPLGSRGWSGTESLEQQTAPAIKLKSLYAALSAAPGGVGKSYALTLNDGGVGTALTVTITNAATTGNITGQSILVSDGDLLDLQSTPSGTPAASNVKIGILVNLGPQTISPTSIGSTAALGSDTVSPGAYHLAPSSLSSTAALGAPTVHPGAKTISPSSIASTLALGAPKFNVTIPISSITSTLGFGTPNLGGKPAIPYRLLRGPRPTRGPKEVKLGPRL